MFQLLGMFSDSFGMFYILPEPPVTTVGQEIITENGAFLITENGNDLITES